MHFTFSVSAVKDVRKLPPLTQKSLKSKLIYWRTGPNPLNFAKLLNRHNEATHRFRIGVYRVLVKHNGQQLKILRVRPRKDVYKR